MKDSSGDVLVRVNPRGPSACASPHAKTALKSPTSSPPNLWRLLLAAASDEGDTLAQCYAVGARGSMSFHIRRAGGSHFAELSLDASGDCRYVMVSACGARHYFVGDHRYDTMRVTDDGGNACAEVRVSSDEGRDAYYELRCAPLADALAMLCGLLCVEWRVASMYSAT